jgi:hypothetical protein
MLCNGLPPNGNSDVEAVTRLLRGHDWLASCLLEHPDGDVIAPLHLFANAPGHRPRTVKVVGALVESGADINAAVIGSRPGQVRRPSTSPGPPTTRM